MASTLAGNVTLLGSVANLMVAGDAHRLGTERPFLEYLKVGMPITLLTLNRGSTWMMIAL